jgi:hypothetical protein
MFFFNKSTLGTIPMAYKKYPCGSASYATIPSFF